MNAKDLLNFVEVQSNITLLDTQQFKNGCDDQVRSLERIVDMCKRADERLQILIEANAS